MSKFGHWNDGLHIRDRKLTDEQVRWVRENYIPGDKELGIRALARRLDISHVTLLKIIRGDRYKHVKNLADVVEWQTPGA